MASEYVPCKHLDYDAEKYGQVCDLVQLETGVKYWHRFIDSAGARLNCGGCGLITSVLCVPRIESFSPVHHGKRVGAS